MKRWKAGHFVMLAGGSAGDSSTVPCSLELA